MKFSWVACWLCAAAVGLAQGSSEVSPDTIVLSVDDVKLTAAQFKAIVESLPAQYRAYADGAGRKQFADELVRTLTLAEEARRQHLDEDPAFKIQSLYRADELLAARAEAAIGKSVKIDDVTLRRYYEAHKAEYERARASHILIRTRGAPVPLKPGARELNDAEALEKAHAVARRARSGENFGEVALSESDDTGSSSKGGEIGWFGHGELAPAFEKAVFQSQAGEILGPVKTEFGYHIIKVEERESRSFDEVKPEIEGKLRPEEVRKAVEDLRKQGKASYDAKFFGKN